MYPCQIPSPTEDQLSLRGQMGPPEQPRPLLSVCTWEMSSARTGCFHIGHALRQFMQVWLFAGLNLIGYKVVNEAKQTFIPMGQWKIRLILAVSEPAQRSPRERRRRSRQPHRAGAHGAGAHYAGRRRGSVRLQKGSRPVRGCHRSCISPPALSVSSLRQHKVNKKGVSCQSCY